MEGIFGIDAFGGQLSITLKNLHLPVYVIVEDVDVDRIVCDCGVIGAGWIFGEDGLYIGICLIELFDSVHVIDTELGV